MPTRLTSLPARALPCALAIALSWPALQGCAQAPQPPAVEMRLLVKAGPRAEGLSGQALAQRAGQVAQLPVRHLSAQGGGWHALALGCAESPACEAGAQRLRAQGADFLAVETDTRRGPAAQQNSR